MNTELFLTNLAIWWAQAVMLAAIASVLAFILRLPAGGGKLLYWQLALVACLFLPELGPWRQEVLTVSSPVPADFVAARVTDTTTTTQIPWTGMAISVLGLGALLRAAMLLAGFIRLRRYRLDSIPLEPISSWGTEADIRISPRVSSPVTFGVRRPVILLQTEFPDLPLAVRDAILCHEVLHIRRRDWLFILGEELVRAVLWFQPAIWWIINEIQLSREQTVDAAAIEIFSARDQYVDALLAVSGAGVTTDPAPAPLFLRRRHLKQRLISILKECPMSKTQRISALAASLALLSGSCWLITNAVPLAAAPQYVSDAQGVAVNMNGGVLIHRTGIQYPPDLAARGVQGTVQVQVKLDGAGNVADATVLSGPDELRKPVLRSVLDWHFSRSAANTTRQISVSFEAPKTDAPASVQSDAGQTRAAATALRNSMVMRSEDPLVSRRIASIETLGLTEQARTELLQGLPVHQGDSLTPELYAKLASAVREYDEHLVVATLPLPSGQVRMIISGVAAQVAPPPPRFSAVSDQPGSRPLRLGGNVAAANLVRKVVPVYPPSAKEARIQGTVTFEATIGTDGAVQNLRLVSGPPSLVQAAMQAVQQWLYKPTLLNGQPVEVLTTIDINFTLLP